MVCFITVTQIFFFNFVNFGSNVQKPIELYDLQEKLISFKDYYDYNEIILQIIHRWLMDDIYDESTMISSFKSTSICVTFLNNLSYISIVKTSIEKKEIKLNDTSWLRRFNTEKCHG